MSKFYKKTLFAKTFFHQSVFMFFPASIDLYLKVLTVLSSYMKNTISIDCYRYQRG